MNVDRQALQTTLTNATKALLAQRCDAGHWTGRLSSSALSTATALGALCVIDADAHGDLIERAGQWLVDHANDDGGWGDTPESPSNLSTTLLAWAALIRADVPATPAIRRARQWLETTLGVDGLTPTDIARGLACTYGRDRTFAVPILTFLAILDPLAEQPSARSAFWKHIPPLPFELAALPHRLLRRFRAGVVSYALPALIAVGQAGHYHRPTRMPLRRLLRKLLLRPTLRKLGRIQPESGGYLEAAPLTSFVAVSLAAIDRREHPVVQQAIAFLRNTVREDGSWPIDTDLATWVSTLAVNALAAGGAVPAALDVDSQAALRDWLLAQQHRNVHPYTQSAPGGWAWTHRTGGVPDVDDTAGAIHALLALGEDPAEEAIRQAARWLLDLQNRDGGWPTFCQGWGKLPFDQSCPDLTAHAMGALAACQAALDAAPRRRSNAAIEKGLAYLHRTQRPDGAWVPLWFGNQLSATGVNPVFGTARVLASLADLAPHATGQTGVMLAAAVGYLLTARSPDGTWGGEQGLPPTLEETSAVVEAFGRLHRTGFCDATVATEIAPAIDWLIERTHQGQRFPPAPIGLYFARLWYHEKLYPLIFTLAALNATQPLT
jgi:squalene-hopene/tetraprenyl-beta-curcumene cyclase